MGQPELLNAKFAYTFEHMEVNTSMPTLLETSIFFRLGSYVSFLPHLNFDRLGFPLIGCGNTLLILTSNFYCSCLKIEVYGLKR